MPKVSIIIPVYNVAEYLKQCLDSIYSQVKDNYEVILVDDGSTDDSGKICDEYKLKYPQTIVIHKDNGGLSDARNAGIKIATGEYIYFLDSDDWLAPRAIETLLDFAIKNNCEVVQGGWYYAYNDYLLYDNSRKNLFILNREQAMKELIKNDYIKNFAWGKLYKSEIVKKYLFVKGVYFEDSYWQHLIVDNVTNYGVIPSPLCYYRQRNDSISGNFNPKILDLLKGYEHRISFIKNKYPNLTTDIIKQYWNLCTSILIIANNNLDDDTSKAMSEYWLKTRLTYDKDFKQAYKYSLKFQLCDKINYFIVLNIFNIFQRVKSRLFDKPLKKVTLDTYDR